MEKIHIVDKIELMTLAELTPFDKNPKEHPEEQILKIMRSIETFGFNVPIGISDEKGIAAGHGRYEASKRLVEAGRLDKVPVIRLDHLTTVQLKAYLIADNKTAESPWNEAILADLLNDIAQADLELDLTAVGFELGEIEGLLEDFNGEPEKNEPSEPNEGSGSGKGTRKKRTGKTAVIEIEGHVLVSTDAGINNRIRQFCDFVEANPPLKERANKIVITKILEAVNSILPN